MNNEPNIDEWLKENFEQFSPDAPDVWQGISKGIQSAQAAQSGTGLAAAVKGSAMVVKIVSAVVAVAGLTAGYFLYTQSEQQPEVETHLTEEIVPAQSPFEKPTSNEQTITPTVPAPTSVKPPVRTDKGGEIPAVNTQPQPAESQNTVSQPQSTPSTNTASDKPEVVATPIEKPVADAVTPQPKPEQNQAPVVKTEQPKQIVETKDTPQPQPAKLPYNPNEGETGFDKANIPNAFSPDNDGLNDRFVIDITGESFYHVMVTDLKGRVVFESFDKTNTWDGKDQRTGVLCPPGNYRWIFQYKFKDADTQHTINGLLKLFN